MKKLLVLFIAALLTGCSTISTPTSSLINTTPIVKVGDSSSVQKNHIVFIPANTKFPVKFSLKGEIFNENLSSTLMASFKQDLYLYKYWASLDGKKWVHSHKLMNVKPSGGFDKSGGKVEISLDLAQPYL